MFLKSAVFLIAWVLIISNALGQRVFSGLPITTHYAPESYKAGANNWDIIQDPNGLIYVANDKGVLVFDGFDWTLYQVRNKTKVRHMALTHQRLYVGAQGEFGFFETRNGILEYTSLSMRFIEPGQSIGEVWRVFYTEENIYFSTIEYIFIYNIVGDTLKKVQTNSFLGISFMVNSTLYALDWETGLVCLEDNRLRPMNGGAFLKHNTIFSILSLDKNNLLIATGTDGIFIYNGRNFIPWDTPYNDILKTSIVNTAIHLSDGNIAFGTLKEGLVILNPAGERVLHLNETGTTTSITIHSLYQDNTGNLWAGTNDGIFYSEIESPFTLFDRRQGIFGAGYAGIIFNNQLYLGTDNGVFILNPNNGLLEPKAIPVQNTAGNVYALNIHGGELLMGHNNGAFKIEGKKAIVLDQTQGIWNFKVFDETQNELLSGHYRGLVSYSYDGSEWKLDHEIKGYSESSRYLEKDQDGHWWISHGYRGVFRIELNEEMDSVRDVHYYNEEKGFPSRIQITMHRINNQLVYAAETGIYVYDKSNDRFIRDHPFNTIFKEKHIREMEEDALGNVYYISDDGPGLITLNEVNEYLNQSYPFRRITDLLNEDTDRIIILDPQNILFCSNRGFIHYNPLKVRNRNQKPKVILKEISLSNGDKNTPRFEKDAESTDSLHLVPFKFNKARFSFVSPNFTIPRTQYRYQLVGFDKEWSDWSEIRQKEYTNLFEGRYIFRVMARNERGIESEIVEFKFNVLPPWYRSRIAYFIYALLMVGFLFLIIHFQRFRYKKERTKLVIEQSRKLEEKESIISSVRNEKLKAEINHKNKELATSTMHLLSKNEFMMKMKIHLNGLISSAQKDEVKKDLHRIIKEIDHNLKDDKAWENFEIHFDEVHGNFSKRIKEAYPQLTPKEVKMCVYLRLNMSTKEIANLMNISVRGVEISRYRIRKKLGIRRETNLTEMIMEF